MPEFTNYLFPHTYDAAGRERSIAFLNANDIVPKNVVGGSGFWVETDDDGNDVIAVTEFTVGGWNGKSRIWHEGCCGSTHYAKSTVRYPLKARPEEFGFAADVEDGGAA